jgi:hypothetical protein
MRRYEPTAPGALRVDATKLKGLWIRWCARFAEHNATSGRRSSIPGPAKQEAAT